MKLSDFLKEEYIIADLKARDKAGLLDEMVSYLSQRVSTLDRESALRALSERESLGSTGIGHGVAIPHGKLRGLDDIMVSFGRSRHGVDFDSMDRLPVHLFFLIIAPENSAAAHLKLLASISRILKSQDFRYRLIRASSPSEIFSLIMEADRRNGS